MNTANCSAQQQDVKPSNPDRPSHDPNTPSSVLSFLFNRVRELEIDELEFLARSSESASHMAFALADTVSNVGCLISADGDPGPMRAGNFELPDNVSSLLFVIADQIRVISELAQIGDNASSMLRHRERGHV
jgi:hypothetical protein